MLACLLIYEGRFISKLRNSAISSILRIGKIRNIRFIGKIILNIGGNFLDDDVIIVTSSANRTQCVCVLFLGLDENHGAKVKKSRHTFRKVAKFTANSRCQLALKNVSLTNIFVLCLVNYQSCIVVSQND